DADPVVLLAGHLDQVAIAELGEGVIRLRGAAAHVDVVALDDGDVRSVFAGCLRRGGTRDEEGRGEAERHGTDSVEATGRTHDVGRPNPVQTIQWRAPQRRTLNDSQTIRQGSAVQYKDRSSGGQRRAASVDTLGARGTPAAGACDRTPSS